MSGVDVRGILERAGADRSAPEGSQAWALARAIAEVDAMIETLQVAEESLERARKCGRDAEDSLTQVRYRLLRVQGGQP